MTITLDPSLEKRLRRAAVRLGQEPEQYVHAALEHAIREDLEFDDEDAEDRNPNTLDEAIERLRLTPERRAEAIARTLATYQPRNPPPPGTSGMERVFGKWPGDETDEEIRAALEAIE